MSKIIMEEMRRVVRREIKNALAPIRTRCITLRRKQTEDHKRLALIEKAIKKEKEMGEASLHNEEVCVKKRYRIDCNTLKRIRARGEFSQLELATVLEVSLTSINRWERGKVLPNPKVMEKIAILRNASRRELRRLLTEKHAVPEG